MSIARPDDLVVIAWSGFDRFNQFSDTSKQETKMIGDRLVMKWSGLEDTDHGGWKHTGGRGGSREFLVNHYHRIERFRHSLDYVKMVEMHSQIVGYELWNFSMIEWFQAETERTVDPRLVKMHQQENFQHFYLGPSLLEVREKVAPLTLVHKYTHGSADTHPTPLVHWTWLKNHVVPEIHIELDLSIEDQVKLDQDRVLRGDVD